MDKTTDNSLIYSKIKSYLLKLKKNQIYCQKIYLYGSYAKGNFSIHSDIDLAIVSDDLSGDIIDDQVLLMKLGREIDSRIEPHPFLPDEFTPTNPFVHTIIETGKDLSFLIGGEKK